MKQQLNPWDEARTRKLVRIDTLSGEPFVLERGVNFFVEVLEALGAQTLFSCEGHPRGFYISFSCDEAVARRIYNVGFFTVEMGGRCGNWVIRLTGNEYYKLARTGVPMSEREKRRILRFAAGAWAKAFLPSDGISSEK